MLNKHSEKRLLKRRGAEHYQHFSMVDLYGVQASDFSLSTEGKKNKKEKTKQNITKPTYMKGDVEDQQFCKIYFD